MILHPLEYRDVFHDEGCEESYRVHPSTSVLSCPSGLPGRSRSKIWPGALSAPDRLTVHLAHQGSQEGSEARPEPSSPTLQGEGMRSGISFVDVLRFDIGQASLLPVVSEEWFWWECW